MIHRKRFETTGHLRVLYEETQYFFAAREWYQDNIARGDEVEFLGYIAALAMEKGSGDYQGIGRIRAVSFAEHGAASVARVVAWVGMGFVVVLPVVRLEYRDPATFRDGYAGPLSVEMIADIRQAMITLVGAGVVTPTTEQLLEHLTNQTPKT